MPEIVEAGPSRPSRTTARPEELNTLPQEVVACLQNARFLHLATCLHNMPHVSLMNYTYLPYHPFFTSTQLPRGPAIIMTSDPHSRKTANLMANPNVSLLVHDWVSARPTMSNGAGNSDGSDRQPSSNLASMLMQMNNAAVSSISATINGEAHFLIPNTPEERWCKTRHLLNNTFSDIVRDEHGVPVPGDGGSGSYIAGEDVKVIIVELRDGRVSDWRGGVSDWSIADSPQENEAVNADASAATMVNGITDHSA